MSCRHHLALEVNGGIVKQLRPFSEVWELRETCALDVADQGAHQLYVIGTILGIDPEAVRLIEFRALRKLLGAFLEEK